MTAPLSLFGFFQRKVLPRLSAGKVYDDIGCAARDSRYWRGACPFHASGGGPSPLDVDPQTLRWSCLDGCKRGGQSVLGFLNGGRFPRAGTGELREAVERAAALAGLAPSDVPDAAPNEERLAAKEERVASLLETFFLRAYLAMQGFQADSPHQEACRLARSWLEDQGFDRGDLDCLPVGLFVDCDLTRQWLLESSFTPPEIDASALAADPRLCGRLVGPIRDPWGEIVSLWARHPLDRPPRMLIKGKWKDRVGLFGLDVALRPASGGRESLLVVERLVDAVFLQSRGLANVAAIGGPLKELSRRRWERLCAAGVRRVTLVRSSRDAEIRGLTRALRNASRCKPPVEVFVIPAERLGGFHNAAGAHGAGAAQATSAGAATARADDDAESAFAPPGISPAGTRAGGLCPLHRCPATVCFCFD